MPAALLTDEEVFGSRRTMSDAEVFGSSAPKVLSDSDVGIASPRRSAFPNDYAIQPVSTTPSLSDGTTAEQLAANARKAKADERESFLLSLTPRALKNASDAGYLTQDETMGLLKKQADLIQQPATGAQKATALAAGAGKSAAEMSGGMGAVAFVQPVTGPLKLGGPWGFVGGLVADAGAFLVGSIFTRKAVEELQSDTETGRAISEAEQKAPEYQSAGQSATLAMGAGLSLKNVLAQIEGKTPAEAAKILSKAAAISGTAGATLEVARPFVEKALTGQYDPVTAKSILENFATGILFAGQEAEKHPLVEQVKEAGAPLTADALQKKISPGVEEKAGVTGQEEQPVAPAAQLSQPAPVEAPKTRAEGQSEAVSPSAEQSVPSAQAMDTNPATTEAEKTVSAGGESTATRSEDVARYQELQRQMAATDFEAPEFQQLWAESETIKNRHGGMPPQPDATTVIDPASKLPMQEVDVDPATLKLSQDVPNFKEGADADTGEVAGQELKGDYTRLGTGRTVVWERLNGDREIITGRHRWQLAKRQGLTDFPVQIVKEADGFTKQMALTFDAEANIRDNQGSVSDYANYFRNSPQYTEETARQRDLLRNAKGKTGWDIGKNATDDVYSLWRAGKISDKQAAAIGRAAPGNEAAQRYGVRLALDNTSPETIHEAMASRLAGAQDVPTGSQGDFFANTAEDEMWKAEGEKVVALRKEVDEQIKAVSGASKRPEIASKLGVDVKDPKAVAAKLKELREEKARWEQWLDHPDLVEKVRGQNLSSQKVSSPPLELSKPESVEEQKARLTQEAEAKQKEAQRAKLEEQANKPLVGSQGDIGQGDLLGGGDLFSAKPDKPFESSISSKFERVDPFTMDEGDLADLFAELFGDRSTGKSVGQFGRGGEFNFPSYDAFRDWMDARYGERDHEGMRLAFAEAPTENKIRYIKENIKGDAHKKAWITNLATGAPLPVDSPPVPRTTPRPTPSGRTQPSGQPSAQPARPGQPPPPPRPNPNAPHHGKFDITALVQLFRQFSKFPVVNERLMRAYGRYVPGTKAVELKSRLMWDTKLAERVLGHEIGHFIDLAVDAMGKGKQFSQRLIPLWDLQKQVWTKTELKNEARSLSREWRGNFANGDRYRDSAAELFADYMSAMFNNPEMVNQKYPKLFDAFQQLRDGKPEFKSAYREIETWLQGGTIVNELRIQDKAAVEKTLDELETPKEASKASFMDRLKFGTLSLWQRAFEKEGKPRRLGESLTDELEYNKTWAAKENALWADDYAKHVKPALDQVNSDSLQARTDLLSYSKAVRTIGERRAAGEWIENNPIQARQILEKILDMDAPLRSKFANDLSSAGRGDLYDLSASIFREIHDRGEPFVRRIERTIDKLNLGIDGEAALMAFNVRGKLLNPGGLTVETAQKMLNHLKDDLGATRYAALERAATNLRDLLYDVQSKMHDEGLISDKTWKELIEPNKDNYLPYAVLDYFDGKVRAGVMNQKGTAKDIADVAAATQLKVSASNVWRQQQRQVELLRDIYAKGGTHIPIGEQLERARDIEAIRAKHLNDDTSRAVLWQDGKPHVVEFPGDKGKLLESAMEQPAFYEHIGWISEASDMTHKVMQFYTQFSVPFLLWRNPIRGLRTAGLKVGFGKIAKQLTPDQLADNYRLAQNYAEAAFGKEMLPEVRDLVDKQILLPPRLSQAMVRDSANLRDLLANHTILANQVRGMSPEAQPRWWKGGEVGRKGIILSEKVFSGYEAFEKIYNYKAALEKGLSPEQAGAIARRSGIPKPGVGGKWSLAMEVFFPWTRVHIQGIRASYDMMRDPELGPGFRNRFVLTEALPRVAKIAIGAGVVSGIISWATGKHEDDPKDGVMAEFMRRVSPYKMALDDTAPLYFYDPRSGNVHYLWEFKNGKSVPKYFEAVSIRIPASEEGRLFGVALYNAMISSPGTSEKLGRPGETFVSNMGSWAANYAVPGLSPIITTADNLKDMILLGRNPKDSYRNQPAANPKLFDAGGVDRAQAIAGYVMNQGGSAGELAGIMAANFGLLDERALNALSTRLPGDYSEWNQKVPFLKTAVSHDNYAQYRDEKSAELAEEQLRAKARLLMPEEPRALYDFYYRNLNRQHQLTDSEKRQFEIAKSFVKDVWGNLKQPHSFYAKAAAAIEGSREARDTLKRDLNTAASAKIAAFHAARNTETKPDSSGFDPALLEPVR